MKSTLRNMLLSLTGVCVITGAALAVVNIVTAEPIAAAAEASRRTAMADILPPFDNDISSTATTGPDGTTLYTALHGQEVAGCAVETFSDAGFGGRIVLLAGFDAHGALTGYRVLSHAETPGLGARMQEWFEAEGTGHDVRGSSGDIAVRADGGDIDAITGATITSRAFTEAINRARRAANTILQ